MGFETEMCRLQKKSIASSTESKRSEACTVAEVNRRTQQPYENTRKLTPTEVGRLIKNPDKHREKHFKPVAGRWLKTQREEGSVLSG